MKKDKQRRLKARGWAIGSAKDFLGLSDEEATLVEIKLALAESLRRRRSKRGLSQTDLARLLGSSQSRVAKMEAGDPSVTLDLLVRSLLTIGATQRDLARIIDPRQRSHVA